MESVHADHPDVPRGLTVLLQQMHSELLDHMAKEEGVLFPMLARGGSSPQLSPNGGKVAFQTRDAGVPTADAVAVRDVGTLTTRIVSR